jgi:hypothetical protein
MKIETKYDIGQTVFVMFENKVLQETISEILFHHGVTVMGIRDSSIKYRIKVDITHRSESDFRDFPEEKVFPTKQDLLNSL